MRPVNVGVIGLGTVGAGTVDLLAQNGAEIARRAGRDIRVTHAAVRDLNRTRDCATADIHLTDDPSVIVGNPTFESPRKAFIILCKPSTSLRIALLQVVT